MPDNQYVRTLEPARIGLETSKSPDLLPAILDEKIERAAAYAKAARASSTRRAYDSDWAIFTARCAAHGLPQLPASPEIVSVFASDQATAGLNPSSINRRVAAIGYHHRAGGYPAPTADRRPPTADRRPPGVWPKCWPAFARNTGLRNGTSVLRTRPRSATCSQRSKAKVSGRFGIARSWRSGRLRRLRLTIAHSKTDQTRQGIVIAIPEGWRIRPKMLLLVWMAAAGHVEGPPFRRLLRLDAPTPAAMSDRAIARLAQHHAAAAGYYPKQFAGQSLCGIFTQGASQCATIFKLLEVSRHKSVQILADYVRNTDIFKDHAGQRFL
jgi:hypothetical protein